MGLLERAHGYKDKIAKGISPNHALFSYPVLMAADILLYSANKVPVGKDQVQHVEIARDIAIKFNNDNGDILTIPEFKIDENVATVPGIDGAKMSKSYGNTIDIFLDEKELKARVSKIITDSTPMEEPKDPYTCNIFNIAKLFLNQNEQDELASRYKAGKEGYGHFKMYLKDIIWEYFRPYRAKREYYLNNKDEVIDVLKNGAEKARNIAAPMMEKIRECVGIYKG
jgi:tryptophanyl-tRNA synthetase